MEMKVLVNILIKDYRFNWDEISTELNKAANFYGLYGVQLDFIQRYNLYEPKIGVNLNFTKPNGSHAYPYQRKAIITLNDWFNNQYIRNGILIHELGHAIFGLPDHYEGAKNRVYTSEACLMNSPNELVFCSRCKRIINDQIITVKKRRKVIRNIARIGIPLLIGFVLLSGTRSGRAT